MTAPVDQGRRRRFRAEVDGRDVVGGLGAVCVVAGSCAFHWALGLIAIGLMLLAVAWRLSREP